MLWLIVLCLLLCIPGVFAAIVRTVAASAAFLLVAGTVVTALVLLAAH